MRVRSQGHGPIAGYLADPTKAVAAVLLVSIAAFILVLGIGQTTDNGQDDNTSNVDISSGALDTSDYRVRIMALVDAGKFDSALAALSDVIEANPDDPAPLWWGAMVYMQVGEYAKAIKRLNKVIELAPREPMAYFSRGLAYMHVGDDAPEPTRSPS